MGLLLQGNEEAACGLRCKGRGGTAAVGKLCMWASPQHCGCSMLMGAYAGSVCSVKRSCCRRSSALGTTHRNAKCDVSNAWLCANGWGGFEVERIAGCECVLWLGGLDKHKQTAAAWLLQQAGA